MQCRKCKKEILDTPFCQFCGANQEPPKTNVKKRGNGQGYARKRGNVWQCEVNFIADGYRFTRTKSGFKTKKEALEYVGVLKSETEKPLKMIELYNYWSKKHYENITKNKENAYKRAWNRLKPISHKEINSIRHDELQSIVDSTDGYYPKKKLSTILHGVYTYAKKINQ